MENENVDGSASKTKLKPKESKAEQSLKKCAKMSEKLAVKSQQLVLWSYGLILWSAERRDNGGVRGERDMEQSVVQPAAMATPAPLTAKRRMGQFVVGCGCGIECGL